MVDVLAAQPHPTLLPKSRTKLYDVVCAQPPCHVSRKQQSCQSPASDLPSISQRIHLFHKYGKHMVYSLHLVVLGDTVCRSCLPSPCQSRLVLVGHQSHHVSSRSIAASPRPISFSDPSPSLRVAHLHWLQGRPSCVARLGPSARTWSARRVAPLPGSHENTAH